MKASSSSTSAACLIAAALMVGSVSCQDPAVPAASAVQFRIDGPLCDGTTIHFHFSIDRVAVGDETLMDGQTSHLYRTSAGQHQLDVTIPGAVFAHDTTVVLQAGVTFVDVLSVYCS
jgi:hypothetical protein